METDVYKTIAGNAEGKTKDKGSKFLAYAYPVETEEEIKERLDVLRKKYYDATHHCYAWRLGADGAQTRANDDGEPSGTAGRPILGQILSNDLTNILIVVVRYFGGTKLGVSGLIAAYREAAAEVIEECEVVEKTVDAVFELMFSYMSMNDVMKVVKDEQPSIISQEFDNLCRMTFAIRRNKEDVLAGKLEKCEGVTFEHKGYK